MEQCPRADTNPSLTNEFALNQQTQPTSTNSKEESEPPQRLHALHWQEQAGEQEGQHALFPASLMDTKRLSIHMLGAVSCWQPALHFLWLTTEEVISFKATNIRSELFQTDS